MKSTIKDVAKLAGVSFKSVSRVINNEPTVSEKLKKKVWAAIEELDYEPNPSARGLRGAPSSIGFIYDNPNSNYVIDIQHGILNECRKQGYELVIHPCDSQSDGISDELAQMVKRSRAGGLILTPPISEMEDVTRALHQLGIKFVRILSGSAAPDTLSPCVFVDDRTAAFDITKYIIELGHRRIGFLAGDSHHLSSRERLRGYKEAQEKAGIPFEAALVLDGEFSFESGIERSRRLLQLAEPPTAIFAANDEIAAGALFTARMMGIEVPQKLTIVGFEDSPFSRQSWPKLTTARQPNELIAQTAAALLIAELRSRNGADPKAEVRDVGFYPELIIRDSSCPVSAQEN